MKKPAALIFDLDGTLLDTADDLGGALNQVLQSHGHAQVPAASYRPIASHGANALLKLGWPHPLEEKQLLTLRSELLDAYAANICQHTRTFDGVSALLDWCEQQKVPWGIVTNKPIDLTNKLLPHLPELDACGVVYGGDSFSYKKPDPRPLLHAAEALKVEPSACWYIGDAERDIQAANAANMLSVCANWGYIEKGEDTQAWKADLYQDTPLILLSSICNI